MASLFLYLSVYAGQIAKLFLFVKFVCVYMKMCPCCEALGAFYISYSWLLLCNFHRFISIDVFFFSLCCVFILESMQLLFSLIFALFHSFWFEYSLKQTLARFRYTHTVSLWSSILYVYIDAFSCGSLHLMRVSIRMIQLIALCVRYMHILIFIVSGSIVNIFYESV